MWEWSSRESQSSFKSSTSLLNAYDDLITTTNENQYKPEIKEIDLISSSKNNLKSSKITLDEMKNIIQQKVESYGLKNIVLVERDYEPQTWQEMAKIFLDYNHLRYYFFKLLAYSNIKECLSAGLTGEDIELLKDGVAPENYNTHIKIPFDFGGKLDYNNLSLMKTHSSHHKLHRLIDMQIESDFLRTYKKIFVPYFEGKIYHD